MKTKILFITSLLLIVGCSKPVEDSTLINNDGLMYHPDTKELYTGKTYKNRLGGTKEFEGSYKDGKPNGKSTFWYENGQKEYERTWKDGELISEKFWNEDGSVWK
jgi:antitoxin component YwqK of YwqJK toxin-antitoxin module